MSYLQYIYIYTVCVYVNTPVGVSVNGIVRYSKTKCQLPHSHHLMIVVIRGATMYEQSMMTVSFG